MSRWTNSLNQDYQGYFIGKTHFSAFRAQPINIISVSSLQYPAPIVKKNELDVSAFINLQRSRTKVTRLEQRNSRLSSLVIISHKHSQRLKLRFSWINTALTWAKIIAVSILKMTLWTNIVLQIVFSIFAKICVQWNY